MDTSSATMNAPEKLDWYSGCEFEEAPLDKYPGSYSSILMKSDKKLY